MRSVRRVIVCLGLVLSVAWPGVFAQEPPVDPPAETPGSAAPGGGPDRDEVAPRAAAPSPRSSLLDEPTWVPAQEPLLPSTPRREEYIPFGDVFQLRALFRHGFLHGNSIGRPQGFFLGQTPKATDAWADSRGFGLSAEWWVVPIVALQTTVTYELFDGKTLTTPVDRVRFDDLGLVKSSVGLRLNFPFGLPLHRWADPKSIEAWQAVVPYVRSGMGLAVTQGVDVKLSNGQRVNYFAQSGSFLFTIAFGLEARFRNFGAFAEVLPYETWGPVEAAREPEAKDWHGSEFPFTLGISWRF